METVPPTAQTDAKIEPEKKAEISITVKQPKVEKPPKEKKELTEGQKRALEKMKEALAKKRQEKIDIKKANEDDERKKREDAVKKAEEEAKKITENVKVEKVRGRKVGTKAPQAKIVRNIPEPVQERQMTQQEYTIQLLRQRGVNVPDNPTPYHLKMLLSRFR
jgi:hypothetical protein